MFGYFKYFLVTKKEDNENDDQNSQILRVREKCPY